MIKTKKQSLIIVSIFVIALMLFTTTYAFFNYTRTGGGNTIKVGRIAFNSNQNGAINLTNIFPIDPEETGIMDDATKVGSVTINITGDTTYSKGLEYLVTAVNVENSIGSGNNTKRLPISINVSVEDNDNNDPATTLGTSDEEYFDNRGTNASTSIYKVLASEAIKENDQLLVGYIKPGTTGVDGNIVIKAYIDKAKVAISDTYTEGDRYEVLSGLSNETISACVTHLESLNYDDLLLTGETLNDFCAGTGTIDGRTFQETLDRGAFNSESLTYLVNNNIIRYLGQDGTTDEWVHEREVFTTTEWNSLQSNGVSFQVKVEANEGIWVKEKLSINVMNDFPSDVFTDEITQKIKEIYFNRMTENQMENRYNAATIKADITYNNEGRVLTWLEENTTDNSKYTMYIASPGETYLTTGKFLFFNGNLKYSEKIEFNNINTSRVTDMSHMFYSQQNLKELNLTNFDTSNVITMVYFVSHCRNLETVNVSGLDMKKVSDMSGMFRNNDKLKYVNLENVEMRDVETMDSMFYQSYGIESINLDNLGGDNLADISDLFSSGDLDTVQEISMKNFNFGKVNSAHQLFYGMSNLEIIDLRNAKGTSITTAYDMFQDNTSLTDIRFDGFDMSNVENVSYMFYGNNNIENIDLSFLSTALKINNIDKMFYGCNKLKTINMSGFDFGTSSPSMLFDGLTSVQSINLSNADFSGVSSISQMFGNCQNLTDLNLSNVNTNGVDNMSWLFYNCNSLVALDLSDLDINDVTAMNSMFNNCSSLTTIYVSNTWNVDDVIYSSDMFYGCTSLVGKSSNTTYSYNSSKTDKTMAVIATDNTEGYLTNISLKPNN